MKVLVAKSPLDGLQMHLKGLVEGLFKGEDDIRNHFKSKVCIKLTSALSHQLPNVAISC